VHGAGKRKEHEGLICPSRKVAWTMRGTLNGHSEDEDAQGGQKAKEQGEDNDRQTSRIS